MGTLDSKPRIEGRISNTDLLTMNGHHTAPDEPSEQTICTGRSTLIKNTARDRSRIHRKYPSPESSGAPQHLLPSSNAELVSEVKRYSAERARAFIYLDFRNITIKNTFAWSRSQEIILQSYPEISGIRGKGLGREALKEEAKRWGEKDAQRLSWRGWRAL
ncbi:unnamed protein product [Danaus chrysippus]|uniref:(African queen) hypothetical protein n=1 Tax=Danaus chrysippus TaxID=151541 RepID=A0A8J2QFD1_9NEOP|nr:unnamed protein product [Danaus chrysippus]